MEVSAFTKSMEYLKYRGHEINLLPLKYARIMLKTYYLNRDEADKAYKELADRCRRIYFGQITSVPDEIANWKKSQRRRAIPPSVE